MLAQFHPLCQRPNQAWELGAPDVLQCAPVLFVKQDLECQKEISHVPNANGHDAFRFGVDIPEGAETIHQERAYTSPIWYTP
jgi:hypothetical protein